MFQAEFTDDAGARVRMFPDQSPMAAGRVPRLTVAVDGGRGRNHGVMSLSGLSARRLRDELNSWLELGAGDG